MLGLVSAQCHSLSLHIYIDYIINNYSLYIYIHHIEYYATQKEQTRPVLANMPQHANTYLIFQLLWQHAHVRQH